MPSPAIPKSPPTSSTPVPTTCWPSRTTSQASKPRSNGSSPMHRQPASMFTATSIRVMGALKSAAVRSHPTSAGLKGIAAFLANIAFPNSPPSPCSKPPSNSRVAATGRGGTTSPPHPSLPSALLIVVRGHWRIENSLHWVLDVVFREDLSRLRKGNGAANIAVVRHFAVNLVRTVQDKRSLKVRRKLAGWDVNYLTSILQPTAR